MEEGSLSTMDDCLLFLMEQYCRSSGSAAPPGISSKKIAWMYGGTDVQHIHDMV